MIKPFCAMLVTAALFQLSFAKEGVTPAITPEPQSAEWAQSWWMPRHEAKLKEKEEAGKIDLLFVGDSITQGWEGAGKDAWEKHFAKKNAFNLGFSGDRTEQVLWRLENGEFDGISPKVAVVMIGTNNTGHRQDPADETAEGIRQILAKMHEKMPKMHIVLLAIFPRGEQPDDAMRKLNNEINEKIKAFDELEYVSFVDIGDKFLKPDGTLSKDVMPDLLHLNPASYAVWAEAIAPEIEKNF